MACIYFPITVVEIAGMLQPGAHPFSWAGLDEGGVRLHSTITKRKEPLVPDEDAKSLGAKLITQLIWYGYSRTLFTSEFIEEMLIKAGFSRVVHLPAAGVLMGGLQSRHGPPDTCGKRSVRRMHDGSQDTFPQRLKMRYHHPSKRLPPRCVVHSSCKRCRAVNRAGQGCCAPRSPRIPSEVELASRRPRCGRSGAGGGLRR